MPLTNVTTITEFVIVGFPSLEPRYYGFVAFLFLILYVAIVLGNTFVLIIVATERRLQQPTYLISCNLAVSDLFLSTATLPKAIARYWAEDKTILMPSCFTQMFFVHFVGGSYPFVLLTMTVDRYIAICNPLRYHSLIKNSTIIILFCMSGLVGVVRVSTLLVLSVPLPYCSSNEILHCYCDHTSITRLACENSREVQLVAFCFAMFLLLVPLSFILFSYFSIFFTILKTVSTDRRYKIFSTFSSEMFIVCLYYIPRCFGYISNIVSYKFSIDIRIAIVFLYTLVPPMVNPLIYLFWTKDIKETAMKKLKFTKTGSLPSHS